MAVAAMEASSRRRREASGAPKPSAETSRSIDQPPAGLTNGHSARPSSMTSRRRSSSATQSATWPWSPRRTADVGDRLRRAGHPADAPADHAVLLRHGAHDDRALGHPLEADRVDERAPVEEEPLHCRVVDEEELTLAAEVANEAPVVLV